MRVLVYPHTMEMGGSQLNAIEIAGAVRDRGHEVMVVSRPGLLVETVHQLGLPHIMLDPRARRKPSPRAMMQLTRLVRQHSIDVVHGYEWPPTLEAFGGPQLRLGLPVVSTIMSGRVAPFLPRPISIVVGADDLRQRTLKAGWDKVVLLEPPVDVRANSPEVDPGSFRKEVGFDQSTPLVAVISRLVPPQKQEGILAACDAVARLTVSGATVQLVIVGDGPSRPAIEEAAAAANARAGRRIVALTGLMFDPRPAYAAADVVLGMGGSALRAMAFGKPLVVQGFHCFWELATPESATKFLRQGWAGYGSDADQRLGGALVLERILRDLLANSGRWAELGAFGRRLVVERYSLDHAAAVQEEVYRDAMAAPGPPFRQMVTETVRSGLGVTQHQLRRKWQRRSGTAGADDMNVVTDLRPETGT